MEGKSALSAMIDQVGVQTVTNLITGCDRIARLLGELPWLERERLRILLNDVIENESKGLPMAAVFVLVTIAMSIEGRERQVTPYPATPDRGTS
jgi:hypothetical protein